MSYYKLLYRKMIIKFEDNKKYTDRLKSARKITKQDDAVSIAKGKIRDINVVVGAQV